MTPGQGFAERVTLANLATYLPLLRRPAEPTESGEQPPERPPAPTLPGHFDGNRLRVPNPFTPYRRPRRAINRPQPRRRLAFTEAGYHYPQGTHLGHILTVLRALGEGDRAGGPLDDRYIRMTGGLGTGRLASYRRQVKYKLQASMEFGIVTDCRTLPPGATYAPSLTPAGRELYHVLKPLLDILDLTQPLDANGIPSARMAERPEFYNAAIRNVIENDPAAREDVLRVFLSMPAVSQMRLFLRRQHRTQIPKRFIYRHFFQEPPVMRFCQRRRISPATRTGAEHRCPFLLNVLEACGILRQTPAAVILGS